MVPMVELVENRYGKSRVRLIKVERHAAHHEIREWTVQILLQGDFDSAHVDGDNSKILPTDTMKNTVYSRARASSARSIEEFAMELAGFFVERNAQVERAEISIESASWNRLDLDGRPQPTTFVRGSMETATTVVECARSSEGAGAGTTVRVISGLDQLLILKTSDSGFEGYIHDSLTTLKETSDRLLGTVVEATWRYPAPESISDFAEVRATVRGALLETFAGHKSRSVQHTLFAMGEAALARVALIDEIELVMPNKHCLLVDLSRFGQDNPNQIFVPTDEPHGTIQARLRRRV